MVLSRVPQKLDKQQYSAGEVFARFLTQALCPDIGIYFRAANPVRAATLPETPEDLTPVPAQSFQPGFRWRPGPSDAVEPARELERQGRTWRGAYRRQRHTSSQL